MPETFGQNDPSPERPSGEQVDLLVRGLELLPTLPAVWQRVVELTLRAGGVPGPGGESAARQIAGVVGLDPALTVRFLRLAGRYGVREARTVAEVVRRMDWDAVRATVLSTEAPLPPGAAGVSVGGLDRAGFWKHCLAVAWAGKLLVERAMLPVDPEEAFACGLLHDIGKLALDQAMPKSYARAVEAAKALDGDVADYERRVVGTDHSVVGRRLAERWGLGMELQQAIWMHHQPLEAIPSSLPGRELVAVVSLADTLAREQRLGFSGNHAFCRTSEQLAEQLRIAPGVLAEVMKDLPERIDQSCVLLGLEEGGGGPPCVELLAKANAELGRLCEGLRRRTESLTAGAKAMRCLGELAASLKPDADICDTLVHIAEVCAAGGETAISPARPVVAYSIGEEGPRAILAVRCDGSARPQWRTFAYGPAFGSARPVGEAPAAEAALGLLGDLGGLSEWMDLSSCAHYPLLCQGRWVGGVFCPSAGEEVREVRQALADALGLALAVVQGRSRAVALSEQFAGASQLLARTQEALAETRTLAAAVEMAAGAAHEINNPLAVISGRAQLMRERARNEESRKTWQLIVDEAQRISDIITDLMEFASPPAAHPEAVEAAELLHGAAAAFSSSDHPQARAARVDIHIEQGTPAVWTDAAQIRRVLVELMNNAANAAKGAARIRLAAQADETHGAVVLSVADDGPGMDEQTLARVYAPLFSRQEAGRRRGMGLPRAKRCVESNGGRMWIHTRAGEGTTVYVQLPAGAKGKGEGRVDVQS